MSSTPDKIPVSAVSANTEPLACNNSNPTVTVPRCRKPKPSDRKAQSHTPKTLDSLPGQGSFRKYGTLIQYPK